MVVIGSAGVLAPGRWRWARSLAWLAGLCVAIVLIFNAVSRVTLWLLVELDGGGWVSSSAAPVAAKLAAAIAGSLALLLTYAVAVRFGERRSVPELGLRNAPSDLLLGLAIGAALMIAIVAGLWVFGWVTIERKPVEAIALALRDSIRSGMLEEVVLRLVCFRLLWRAFGIWPALAGAALLFGVLHLANPEFGPVRRGVPDRRRGDRHCALSDHRPHLGVGWNARRVELHPRLDLRRGRFRHRRDCRRAAFAAPRRRHIAAAERRRFRSRGVDCGAARLRGGERPSPDGRVEARRFRGGGGASPTGKWSMPPLVIRARSSQPPHNGRHGGRGGFRRGRRPRPSMAR